MKLSQAIELFLKFKSKELAHRTIKEYKSDLNKFRELIGDKNVSEIRTADIMIFRTSLDCSPSLINRRMSALNTFFNFLVDMEVISSNPFKPSLRIKKVKQKIPEALTEEEVEKILTAAQQRSQRDYLLIKTILYCGLRISEALNLKRDDIITVKGRKVLKVLGKGNKERFIPLPSELAKELMDYIKNLEGERLFPLKYHGAKYVFDKIKEKTGIYLHPHKLRHTFATLLVDRGVDIRVIQAFLGHASPNTSARYAKVRDDVMFKVIDEVFDKSQTAIEEI
ncbi:integrase/recombinase XerD [Desulfurobacterium pacificum]|uniref:Integrase/recombinase XerD n=1 Tax=Desulfurobacterium pacificum TaxID=240166 RepID=A0ABY1N9N0_9BACT|nr:tyrosine-type recombinase/integrase [Desulfurobacterium pacificum]SMP03863.1 integrase/recombinase XerD [Desulfurobacterium pacificum]